MALDGIALVEETELNDRWTLKIELTKLERELLEKETSFGKYRLKSINN